MWVIPPSPQYKKEVNAWDIQILSKVSPLHPFPTRYHAYDQVDLKGLSKICEKVVIKY